MNARHGGATNRMTSAITLAIVTCLALRESYSCNNGESAHLHRDGYGLVVTRPSMRVHNAPAKVRLWRHEERPMRPAGQRNHPVSEEIHC